MEKEKKSICISELALGLARLSKKELVTAVDVLVEKGAMTKERSEKFLQDAQAEGAECKKAIGDKLQGSAKKILKDLGVVTSADVAKLHKEIKVLKALHNPVSTTKT